VLIPDFKGSEPALRIVMEAEPDILNHNLETAERLYRLARPGGRYHRALELLTNARRMSTQGLTKSGVILGMGEEWDEVLTCMRDLRRSDVNILTLGQYLRPSLAHMPVARYYTPAEFDELREIGLNLGFTHVQSSPLTRSSYHAWEQVTAAISSSHPERSEGSLLSQSEHVSG
jgi:lipoic acid synthetase